MGMWRQEDPVLNSEGQVIKGGMWEHQRRCWNSKAFIKALVMGYGGGKTFFQGKRAIAMARHNPQSPYMIVSPSYKLAKRTVIPTIEELLNGRQIRHRYNKSEFEFKIAGGGTIWIASGDEPKSLPGPNLCGAGIDEPFLQDRAVFMQMLARVRCRKARHREILLTGTPEDLNWGYDICEGDERDKYNLELIQASSHCNKALPKEYLETLDNAYDEKMRDAYIDGKFVNMTTGRIYYGFDKGRNVQARAFPPGAPSLSGQDFNVDPMAGILFWTSGPHMHIYGEIELPNSDTDLATKEAIDKAREKGSELSICYPDPSGKARKTSALGKTDFTIIKDNGVEVKARLKAPAIRDRMNAVNMKLQAGTLTIDPGCKSLIKYLQNLSWENLRKQESMTHLTDAMGYPVEYLYPIKKPIIQVNQ